MILMLIYPLGFLITLTFFKYFGKQIGFDYDPVSEEDKWNKWPDDWESNEQAYFGFATMWFMIVPVLIAVGLCKGLYAISKWYLKL
jgi:hypothetical protein